MLTTNPSENQLTRVHAFFGLIRCLDGYQRFPKSANLKNFNLCASKSEKAKSFATDKGSKADRNI